MPEKLEPVSDDVSCSWWTLKKTSVVFPEDTTFQILVRICRRIHLPNLHIENWQGTPNCWNKQMNPDDIDSPVNQDFYLKIQTFILTSKDNYSICVFLSVSTYGLESLNPIQLRSGVLKMRGLYVIFLSYYTIGSPFTKVQHYWTVHFVLTRSFCFLAG